MKRYQFGLATVLRARRAQEDVAKASLLQAHQAAARAANVVQKSKAHYLAAAAASGAEFRLHREMWELAARSVTSAEQAEERALHEVQKATDQYVSSARAVSVVAHLDETRRAEHATGLQREEAGLVDELVTAKYVRNNSRPTAPSLPSTEDPEGDLP